MRRGRRIVLHREPDRLDCRAGVEPVQASRRKRRLHRRVRGRICSGSGRSLGRQEEPEHRQAARDAARNESVPEFQRGGRRRNHRRGRYGQELVPLRLLVSGARGRSHAEALSRRDGFRADASEGRPERKEPEGFHGDSRSARVRPGPGPVLVQLLRLRRHPRAGQHLFPQRRGRDTRRRRGESRHRRDLRVGRRLRDARPRSLQAARRPGHLRRGRSARLQG